MPRLMLGLILCLSGCAGTHFAWRHPDGNEGFKLAWYECERDARVTTQRGWGILSRTVVNVDDEFLYQCMEARGWQRREVADQ